MSLARSLNQFLVNPLVRALHSVAGLDAARAALVEKWPMNGSLVGSEGTPITFTRASKDNYPTVLGGFLMQAINAPSYGAGLALNGSLTNICTNNNLAVDAALTNITDGANVTSSRVVGGALNAGTDVYVVESTASAASGNSVQIGGTAATATSHSAKLVFKVTAGAGGWLHIGTTPTNGIRLDSTEFVVIDLNDYTATIGDNLYVTPDNGATIQWLGNCFYNLAFATPHIVETLGATGTLAQVDAQLSTTGFPVNGCSYYLELPKGVRDNGTNQVLIDSFADASNYFRVNYSLANGLRVIKRVGGTNYILSVPLVADGTPFSLIITQDSTSGIELTLSNGLTDSDPDTQDIQLDSVLVLGRRDDYAQPLYSEEAQLKVFNEVVTLEAAKWT